MADLKVLFKANSNTIQVVGLKNKSTGDYLNSQTVTVTLRDAAGAALSGQSWPLTLDYTAGSDGDYTGTISSSVSFGKHRVIKAFVDCNAGSGLVFHREVDVEVQTRK